MRQLKGDLKDVFREEMSCDSKIVFRNEESVAWIFAYPNSRSIH